MVNIFYSSEFRKEVKRLAKKYRSIPEDLIELRNRLIENPVEGAINITLLTIYDKSERSSISDKEIKDLLKTL